MKYVFSRPESLIKEVEVFDRDGTVEALIHIPQDATAKDLAKVKLDLEKSGYGVLAGGEKIDGSGKEQPVLRVFGFNSANNLLSAMGNSSIGSNKAVFGDYSTVKNERDEQQDKGLNIKKLALTASGVLYEVGDVAVMTAGFIRKDWAEVAQGFIWNLPSWTLMFAGEQNPQTQMPYLYGDFNEFLHTNDIRVPTDVQTLLEKNEKVRDGHFMQNILSKVGLDSVWKFSTDHAPTFNAWMQVTGAIAGVKAGQDQENDYKRNASALMGAGMFYGAITPQEKHVAKSSVFLGNNIGSELNFSNVGGVPEPENDSLFNITPMNVAGGSALAQNFIKLAGVYKVDKPRRKEFDDNFDDKLKDLKAKRAQVESGDYDKIGKFTDEIKQLHDKKEEYTLSDRASTFDAISTVAYMVANVCTTMVDKDNTPNLVKSGGVNSLVEMSANIINEYPQELQKAVTQRIATFLGNHKYVRLTVDEVVTLINDKMEVLAESKVATHNGEVAEPEGKFTNPATRLDLATSDIVHAKASERISTPERLEKEKVGLEKIYGEGSPENKVELDRAKLEQMVNGKQTQQAHAMV